VSPSALLSVVVLFAAGVSFHTETVKVAVSLPDELFLRADALAEELDLNRSQLFVRALQNYLDSHDSDPVTVALDRLADSLPVGGERVGRRLIDSGTWEW